MPKPTLDQQKEQVEKLQNSLAEKGDGMEVVELREFKKKIRRAQRKHQRMAVEASRCVAKPVEKTEEKAEAKPAEKVEAKPVAKPEEKPEAKVEEKVEAKPVAKPEEKPEAKVEEKVEAKPEEPAEEKKEEAADQPES